MSVDASLNSADLAERSRPVINVLISVSQPRREALRQANRPEPPPFAARMLIDTGASSTLVDKPIIQQLKLTPTGSALCHTPSTGNEPVVCDRYDVRMSIAGPQPHLLVSMLPVVEADLSMQHHIDGLIGRDILARCLLVYNGPEDTVALAY